MFCWKIINFEKNILKYLMGNYGYMNLVIIFLEMKFYNFMIFLIGIFLKIICVYIDENVNFSK